MIISYDTLFEKSDGTTKFTVGSQGHDFILSLSSKNFDVKHKDGLAIVDLFKHLNVEEALTLGRALVKAAATTQTNLLVAMKQLTDFDEPSEELPPDDDCPVCGGHGKIETGLCNTIQVVVGSS